MSNTSEEESRLRSLASLGVLDSSPEAEFDALAKTAALICGVPIALVSLVDEHRQWFKANVGLPELSETPRDVAFCAHTINGDSLFVVPDATKDERFANYPLVTRQPRIVFYAGAPIRLCDGMQVGALCVMDHEPRVLSNEQQEVLVQLAIAVARALEARVALQKAEQAAREKSDSERTLRLVVDTVPALMAYWNRDLRCKFANRAHESWYGMKAEDLVGMHMEELIGPVRFAVNKPHIDAALNGQARAFEGTVRAPDNIERNSLAHFVPDIVDGQVAGFLVHISDVSQLKMSEKALRWEMSQREQAFELLRTSNASLSEAQRLGRIGSWAWSVADDVTTWSDELHRIFGLEPSHLAPSYSEQSRLYTPESFARLGKLVEDTLKTGEPYELELQFTRADGSTGWLEAHGEAERNEAGVVTQLHGTVQDITERRALTDKLDEQHELIRVTLESIADAVITTNRSGHVTWLNPAAERLTGWPNSGALGRPITEVFDIVHEETRKPSLCPVDVCVSQGVPVKLEDRSILLARTGKEFGVQGSSAPLWGGHGVLLGAVLVFQDVTEQRRLNGEMSYRATHDALTGLTNRAEFEARLGRTLVKAHQERSEHALLYIDLDQFKLVNDACGHAAGDQLLSQVAKLLRDTVRAGDTLSRLGGDEFAVILEYCTSAQAQHVAQKICNRMDQFRFIRDGRRFRVGGSIGLVPLDSRWESPAAALQAADVSCYAAKEAGRNCVHTWLDTDVAMHARHKEAQWAARLDYAIDEGLFVLHAQEIVPLQAEGRNALYAEVLLRMVDTDGSLISPSAFLPAAERFHLSSRIDSWVLGRVVATLQAQPELSAIDTLCVNLSGQSIGDRLFLRQTVEILRGSGMEVCKRLCLEITETAAVTNLIDAAQFVQEVRALGVRVALDDFGAGASSFKYLKSLAVDIVKIDGQFVRDVMEDPLDDATVRCFVEVAQMVGVKTVAEFVDKPAVLVRMKEIGVDFGQGFLLHHPEPIENLLERSISAQRDPKEPVGDDNQPSRNSVLLVP
jgi:diguanylate cyclase (GGDEF)-like protein/PAS domain S-box-containing protein